MTLKTKPRPMTDAQAALVLWETGTLVLDMERSGRCSAAQADLLLMELLDFCCACVAQHDAQQPAVRIECSNVVTFGKRLD